MRYEPTSVTLNSTEQIGYPIQPRVVVGVTAILVVHHSICYEETMLPGTKLMLFEIDARLISWREGGKLKIKTAG